MYTMEYIPTKLNHGDPLFEAASTKMVDDDNRHPMRMMDHGVTTKGTYDPCFMDLMIHSPRASMPLHSYYKEFRLGHGDPLLKEAMRYWPCATILEESAMTSHRPRKNRSLIVRPCHAVSDPSIGGGRSWSPTTSTRHENRMMNLDNVGHIEEHELSNDERRFILMSDDRRFVVVQE